jgi:hypothetical protein
LISPIHRIPAPNLSMTSTSSISRILSQQPSIVMWLLSAVKRLVYRSVLMYSFRCAENAQRHDVSDSVIVIAIMMTCNEAEITAEAYIMQIEQ